MAPPIALQLYTVRNLIAASTYAAVVEQVAAIGYPGVETAGFPGTTAAEAAKLFKRLGLQVPSGHFPLPLGDAQTRVLDEANSIGCKRLVSGRGPDDFKTADAIKQSCDLFNQASAVARANGMSFAIHNHWWEFEKLADRPVYEIMLDHLDQHVLFEVDVYWVKTAGADPAKVVAQLGKRAALLHIKDGPCERGQPMTAVGEGIVDFAAINAAGGSKADWWIAELDECATDMMEAVRKSYQFLTSKGFDRGK